MTTLSEKVEAAESRGWKYIPDPTTWTGGIWYHDQLGCVNFHGGKFKNIVSAVEGLERFENSLNSLKEKT